MPCTISDFKDSAGNWYQAGAQAYYSCQRLEAETIRATNYLAVTTASNLMRNGIALLQQAASFDLASKQFDIQNRNLDRMNLISNEQLDHAKKLRLQWERGVPCENKQTDQACDEIDGIKKPNYQLILGRTRAQIAPPFQLARRQAKFRYGVNCKAAACAEMAQIDLKEAQVMAAQTEAAYRKEEALYEQRRATAISYRMTVLQHNRGMLANASTSMNGALEGAKLAANINPYYGFSQAINLAAGYWSGASTQSALSNRGNDGFNSQGLRTSNMQNTQTRESLGSVNYGADNYDFQNVESNQADFQMNDVNVNGNTGVLDGGQYDSYDLQNLYFAPDNINGPQ